MSDNMKDRGAKGRGFRIFREAVLEILRFSFGFTFTTSVFAIIAQLLSEVVDVLEPIKWPLTALLVSMSGLIFIVLYQRYYRYRPTFPALDFDFRIIEKEISYEYKDKTHITYRKRCLLKSLRDNLDVYYDKYHWTGLGRIDVKSAIKEHQYRETVNKNVWRFYEIRLQKSLKRGEEIETELIFDLEDIDNKAVPFLSATIEEPTDLLLMSISLPHSLGVREATCESSTGIGARRPFLSKTVPIDRNGQVKWSIKEPRLLHHYEVRWSFPEDD